MIHVARLLFNLIKVPLTLTLGITSNPLLLLVNLVKIKPAACVAGNNVEYDVIKCVLICMGKVAI